MNIGFNQPKKQIMHFKEISASRSFYSNYVLILARYLQINAPNTSGDARAVPGILPSEGLSLLWQQHVLQDPIQRQPVTHAWEMAKLCRRAHCSTSGTVTHMPVSTCRNARDKAGGFVTVHRAVRLPASKLLHLGEKIPFTLLNKFRLFKGQKVCYH